MNRAPSPRQLDVLRAILATGPVPPSRRELAVTLGLSSWGGYAVQDHLAALLRKGMLRPRTHQRTRDLVLTRRGRAWALGADGFVVDARRCPCGAARFGGASCPICGSAAKPEAA